MSWSRVKVCSGYAGIAPAVHRPAEKSETARRAYPKASGPEEEPKMLKAVTILAALCLSATPLHAADSNPSLEGEWARGDGKAKVRIAPCGEDVCAINTWIRPGVPNEKVGDRLVMTIMSDGPDKWVGKAYDPQRHMTFRMTIDVAATSMTTHGCVLGGLLCKSMDWTRI
jgi:uncharacterized protein (DUF2147 family)